MATTITTNNVPRWLEYGHELSDAERKEFDYLEGDSLDNNLFFRYKGQVYDLNEFVRLNDINPNTGLFKGWHAIKNETFFSGLIIKITDDSEQVIVGMYTS